MKGILLINLGSPKDLEDASIKEYLKEFLSDDLVIDYPKVIQQILVNWLIVPNRYKKTKEAYSQIWTDEGSPLISRTIELGNNLNNKTSSTVEVAMRYQKPSIENALIKLSEKNVSQIKVIPLYPHYAMSTSLTTQREVMRIKDKLGLKCSIEFIDSFYNEKSYIDALCAIIKNKLQPQSNYLLFSYHGIPNRHLKKTDPTKNHCLQSKNCCDLESKAKPYCYKAQVIETSKLCAENLSLKSNEWGISFQSRIGPGWIEPFTDIELKDLANQGIKNLDVVCPSFVIDNLETLEEMNLRGRETFVQAGGENFNYIPCLNSRKDWVEALIELSEK